MIKTPPELLQISNLSETPSATDFESLHVRAIILGTDLARDRGQLIQLVGAVKQREFSEQQIVDAEEERAREIDVIIEDMNSQELKRAKPWWKLF